MSAKKDPVRIELADLDLFGQPVAPPGQKGKWRQLFSADTDEWATPDDVVRYWEDRLGRPFTLDVAATKEMAKAPRFYTIIDNALVQDWVADAGPDGLAWCNPPYSNIDGFMAKAIREAQRGLTTVLLLPSRTDRPWFHWAIDELDDGRAEIFFCKGRLRFGGATTDAPFPSVVIVIRGSNIDDEGCPF